MTARLTAEMQVGALVRRASMEGGFATILYRGDAISGAILVQCLEKGQEKGLFERIPNYKDGGYRLVACGPDPADQPSLSAYIARRRKSDPDLWIIELDIASAERFAAETIC